MGAVVADPIGVGETDPIGVGETDPIGMGETDPIGVAAGFGDFGVGVADEVAVVDCVVDGVIDGVGVAANAGLRSNVLPRKLHMKEVTSKGKSVMSRNLFDFTLFSLCLHSFFNPLYISRHFGQIGNFSGSLLGIHFFPHNALSAFPSTIDCVNFALRT